MHRPDHSLVGIIYNQDMEVREWQARLVTTFESHREILPILEAEDAFGASVEERFRGFAVLGRAFQTFMVITLRAAEAIGNRVGIQPPHQWYRPVLLSFAGVFHVIRSAERLYRSGHPLNGYGLIRDVKDRAFAYATILNGVTTFERVNGWDAVKLGIPSNSHWLMLTRCVTPGRKSIR